MKNKSLKLVFRSPYLHEAQIAKAKLESEHINSYLVDENLTYTIGTAFIEDYKLMVDSTDFDSALSILSLHKT
ncbi:putative signal transducing protein [Aureibaculum conchae]|uniref:putative signal transducing protein n=1 Tax=Aureibaculum sp. 2308TA14-22 TaxID=3108392 RepID=UPI0033926533